jgi:acyl-CoA thioester hydrolase
MRGRDDAVAIEFDVPFHDVDAMQIVWHGHYLKYLEVARTALMRARGIDVAPIVAAGYAMVVAETRCRHTHPLRYGDRARVLAWCMAIDHRVQIRYEVWNDTAGRRSARASTTLVTTDLAGNLQYETPEFIAHALRPR